MHVTVCKNSIEREETGGRQLKRWSQIIFSNLFNDCCSGSRYVDTVINMHTSKSIELQLMTFPPYYFPFVCVP